MNSEDGVAGRAAPCEGGGPARPAGSAVGGLALVELAAVLGVALTASAACGDGGGGGDASGTGGGGGAGGGGLVCPEGAAPLFTLRVHGPGGDLPADLELLVSWSAGDEPAVLVDRPATHGTSASNVICALVPLAATGGGDGGAAADAPLEDVELVCELWTSGPTRVRLAADGYVAIDETLVPATTEGCDRPVPSEVTIELVVEDEPEDGD